MDLIKQYIIQSISAASNNLRLSTQKIEVVSLLRDSIHKSSDLENDIREMKKVTELSKFAIRLHEIYSYLTQPYVDFFKVSEKFKEHSQYLIKDLSNMLDTVNPVSFNIALNKIHPAQAVGEVISGINQDESISVDLSKRNTDPDVFENETSSSIKEKMILDDDKDEVQLFHNYESQVLSLIKPLDEFLQGMDCDNIDEKLLLEFKEKIQKNADLSLKIGFEIIAEMHKIISRSLELIHSRKLIPDKHIIESIRACLIVIVAVVKGKEIDITGYLNRAEEFGNKIFNLN